LYDLGGGREGGIKGEEKRLGFFVRGDRNIISLEKRELIQKKKRNGNVFKSLRGKEPGTFTRKKKETGERRGWKPGERLQKKRRYQTT